jgi:RecB family exonuclease
MSTAQPCYSEINIHHSRFLVFYVTRTARNSYKQATRMIERIETGSNNSEILQFLTRTSISCPDRLWGPPNLLLNGYRG